jgi:transposase-like protein
MNINYLLIIIVIIGIFIGLKNYHKTRCPHCGGDNFYSEWDAGGLDKYTCKKCNEIWWD